MAFPSASFWSKVCLTVAANGMFLTVSLGRINVPIPVAQVSCAFAVGMVSRRVETAASTVEGLIVVLSCLGRIGSGDRIYVGAGGGNVTAWATGKADSLRE